MIRGSVLAASLAVSALAGCAGLPTASGGEATEESAAPAALPLTHPLTHPRLREALLELRERDQAARGRMIASMQRGERIEGGGIRFDADGTAAIAEVQAIDTESTAFLREVVANHGWPTFTMVGADGAGAAWILAQHADDDPAFQAEVLALLEPLVERGQAEPSHFALLTDRVRTGTDQPQLYGTQFTADANGVSRPMPIEDAANVDARRATVGLPPLAEYARSIAQAYGGETSPIPMPAPDPSPAEPPSR